MAHKRSRFARFATGLVCFLTIAFTSEASAQKKVYELGVYMPRLMFKNNLERVDYSRQVAKALAEATGLEFNSQTFARYPDLATFVAKGRIDIVLADVGVVAEALRSYNILGAGSGPEGSSPAYAVLATKPVVGVRQLEGQRLALPNASRREIELISNGAFEGELAVERYFSDIQLVYDLPEVMAKLRSSRAECTVGYRSQGRSEGLKVVAVLRGIPLPVLAGVKGRLNKMDADRISSALSQRIGLPQVGPLNSLKKVTSSHIAGIVQSIALPPGVRPVRRAVWSPEPHQAAQPQRYRAKSNGPHPLPKLNPRWRVPKYPEL